MKLRKLLLQIFRQFLHHLTQAVHLLDRRVRIDVKGKLIVVDHVFLILIVEADPLPYFVKVDRRREPRPDQFSLVVFAEICDIDPHFFHRRFLSGDRVSPDLYFFIRSFGELHSPDPLQTSSAGKKNLFPAGESVLRLR